MAEQPRKHIKEVSVVALTINDDQTPDAPEVSVLIPTDTAAEIISNAVSLLRALSEAQPLHTFLQKGLIKVRLENLQESLDGSGIMAALNEEPKEDEEEDDDE